MKRLFVIAAAMLLAAGTVGAQTPEEMQASAERIVVLEQTAPKDCGIDKIDEAVTLCKSVAAGTVAIAEVTVSGGAGDVDFAALNEQIGKVTTDLSDAGKVLGQATAALKGVKNPMKLKSAKKALDYVVAVSEAAGEELPYQGRLVAAMVSGQ